jgi:hypothetical protein
MPDLNELVTVFRSADESAEEDAQAIGELLSSQRLHPVVHDDSAPGVPEGAWEVRVPAAESSAAEHLIAQARLPEDDLTDVSDSAGLDMETVFVASGGTTAEMEATGVQNVLENSGIAAVMVGNSVLPNLAFEVRVAHDQVERAKQVIAEAQAAGPAAAEEAERATE